jgi:outer membrane biogenesis lipoprotein LolB
MQQQQYETAQRTPHQQIPSLRHDDNQQQQEQQQLQKLAGYTHQGRGPKHERGLGLFSPTHWNHD